MNTSDELQISTVADGDSVTVTIAGEIDVNSCGEVEAAIDAHRGQHVALDLTGVGFIDSSGLRSMITGQRNVTDAGGSVRIVALSPATRRLLEITGLLGVFAVD